MTPEIQQWVNNMNKHFILASSKTKILEVGSKNINGTVRQYFKGSDYIGIDMEPGENVDIVMNAHDLYDIYDAETFDVIICLEVLEHDIDFLLTCANMRRIVKTGGYLLISTPTFGFPLHRYPFDYWRFGEDAYRQVLFEGFEILHLTEVHDTVGNPGICCIGKKP